MSNRSNNRTGGFNMLKKGSKGYTVGLTQLFLQSLGFYKGKIDNDFGAVTENAVKSYQKAKKLSIDGKIDSETANSLLNNLKVNLKKGSKGSLVNRYMGLLKVKKYYSGKVDSIFGPLMEASVKKYQKDRKLTVDGVIGNITGKSLYYTGAGISGTPTEPSPKKVETEKVAAYKIYYLDKSYGGNILQNPEIADNIPQTALFKKIAEMSKNGRVVVELGEGNGENVLVEACIHGNEEEASIATMKYLESVKDKKIKGKLYVVPFAFPANTAKNQRNYIVNAKSYDPNRTANYPGSPGHNIVNFAKKKGIKRILDNHSGGGVSPKGLIFYRYDTETKWYNKIKSKSGCTGQKIGGIVGSIRKVANDNNMSCITLEVERDTRPTRDMATTNYKMLVPAMQFFGFP